VFCVAVVMIGVGPHEASHTAVAIGAAEEPLGELRVRACAVQAGRLLAWPQRTWAVEGAGGLGHLLAQQQLAAGERVLDVRPKLGARVRLLAAGDTNKNDPDDARSVAIAALGSAGVQDVRADEHAAVLKIWSKRDRDLGRSRTQVACRLSRGGGRADPGGIATAITAAAAARLLEPIAPAGAVEAARCELAAAFTEDLRGIDARIRETRKKLAVAVQATGTSLTGLYGVGPVVTAAVIGDVRDVSRFPGRDHFAAYDGTAPIEVSSGQRKICRLSRRGNRRHGHAIHMAAVTQIGHRHGQARAYDDKKLAEGKTPTEALRALKRQISNAIFAWLQNDARRAAARARGPGRATGERLCSLRGRITPQAPALRTSHSRARSPPCDRGRQPSARPCPCPGQSWPFPGRCHPAAGAAAGPGAAPAAQPGRTTWRCGKTTATLGREEGPGSRITPKATAPEGHFTGREEHRRSPLDTEALDLRRLRCSAAGRPGRTGMVDLYGIGPGLGLRVWQLRLSSSGTACL
jgi:transposase